MKPTLVRWDEIEWNPAPLHLGLFYKEVLSKEEWAARSLRVWKMLVDKIEPGGAVLPHFHDVAEIIHFLEEEVSILLGEQRAICHPGDTIIVPAGVVHSVANKGGATLGKSVFSCPIPETRMRISATRNWSRESRFESSLETGINYLWPNEPSSETPTS